MRAAVKLTNSGGGVYGLGLWFWVVLTQTLTRCHEWPTYHLGCFMRTTMETSLTTFCVSLGFFVSTTAATTTYM